MLEAYHFPTTETTMVTVRISVLQHEKHHWEGNTYSPWPAVGLIMGTSTSSPQDFGKKEYHWEMYIIFLEHNHEINAMR